MTKLTTTQNNSDRSGNLDLSDEVKMFDDRQKKLREEEKHERIHSSTKDVNAQVSREIQQLRGIMDGIEEKEKENLGNIKDLFASLPDVVHPWHLHLVQHTIVDGGVIIDDPKFGSGFYRIAQYSDNLHGKGLIRKETGQGSIRLPSTWGNVSHIIEAADMCIHEALGKNDMDKRHLIPKALSYLSKRTPIWPTADWELSEYFDSPVYALKVKEYYARKHKSHRNLAVAKIMKISLKLGGNVEDAEFVYDYLIQVRGRIQ